MNAVSAPRTKRPIAFDRSCNTSAAAAKPAPINAAGCQQRNAPTAVRPAVKKRRFPNATTDKLESAVISSCGLEPIAACVKMSGNAKSASSARTPAHSPASSHATQVTATASNPAAVMLVTRDEMTSSTSNIRPIAIANPSTRTGSWCL